jgi:hypothetical protein
MAQAVSSRHPGAEARVRSGSVHVGFVVEEVALGQVFTEYFGLPLSISFHRGSITRKLTIIIIIIIIIIINFIIKSHKKP